MFAFSCRNSVQVLMIFILVSNFLYCCESFGFPWFFRRGILKLLRSRPPPLEVCHLVPGPTTEGLQWCDNSAPSIEKDLCHYRGCCYDPHLKFCLHPIPTPGIAICRTGCSNIIIEGSGLERIWSGPGHYGNDERTSVDIIGPCYLYIDKIQVEKPDICRFDYLTIMGERICTAENSPILVPPGVHELLWRSDHQVTDKGFTLHTVPIDPESLSVIEEPSGELIPLTTASRRTSVIVPHESNESAGILPKPNDAEGIINIEKPEEAVETGLEKELKNKPISTDVIKPDGTKEAGNILGVVAPVAGAVGVSSVLASLGTGGDSASAVVVDTNTGHYRKILLKPSNSHVMDSLQEIPQRTTRMKTAGIVIGAVCGVLALISFVIIFFWIRRNRREAADPLANIATGYDYNIKRKRELNLS